MTEIYPIHYNRGGHMTLLSWSIALGCGKYVGGIYTCKTLMMKASVIVPGVHDKDWV